MKRIAVFIIYFCCSCPILFASSAPNGKVAISVAHKDGYNFFVAKKGNKTLWRYDAWGTMFRDSYSGMSVLESANLLVVDRYGKVRKQLSIGAVESPQFLSLMHGNLVFEMGNLAPGVIVPKDWRLTAEWYRTARRICAYNVRTLRYLWSAGETDIGTPVSCNGRDLDTLRIVNFIQCLKNPRKTPIVAIDEINVTTGHRICSAILSISRTDALSLKSCFFGGGANPPAHIIWTPTGGHVYGLFGGNYVGKIISARQKLKKRSNV